MSWTEESDLEILQESLGYHFKDLSLLMTALTHSTWAYEHIKTEEKDNERLEFLGDSVLGLSISTHLYNEQMMLPEGRLSRLRAQVVCEETLSRVAHSIDLGRYLRLGVGEGKTGGREKASNLSNALEAVFGAVYLDGGFDKAFEIVSQQMRPYYDLALAGKLIYDFKTTLFEKVQSYGVDHRLEFRLLKEEGPMHDRSFEMEVFIDGRPYARGTGHTKKGAEQIAAERTLVMLGDQNLNENS